MQTGVCLCWCCCDLVQILSVPEGITTAMNAETD
jgi:hypothetical protein